MRAGAHSDYGAITLLHQGSGSLRAGGDTGGSLQIETAGDWRSVPVCRPGLSPPVSYEHPYAIVMS